MNDEGDYKKMEKFIQEVILIFIIIAIGVILFYAITFLFWIMLIAVITALLYRIIKYVANFIIYKNQKVIKKSKNI